MKLKFGTDGLIFFIIWIVFGFVLANYTHTIPQRLTLLGLAIGIGIACIIFSIWEGNSE